MSRCLPENIVVPSLAQSQVGTRVPSTSTTRPAEAPTGSGTCLARAFSTTGSRTVQRRETVAWETPNNSAAEMQWQLLPGRSVARPEFRLGAHLEPAYAI
ncbi:phosphatase, partial [[Kitasatospora] papulosa]